LVEASVQGHHSVPGVPVQPAQWRDWDETSWVTSGGWWEACRGVCLQVGVGVQGHHGVGGVPVQPAQWTDGNETSWVTLGGWWDTYRRVTLWSFGEGCHSAVSGIPRERQCTGVRAAMLQVPSQALSRRSSEGF
jgi:hypothetical protein